MPSPTVTEEQIRLRAYELWQSAGAPHGRDQDFWFQAEAELTTPKKKPAPRRKAAAPKAAKPARAKAAAEKPAARAPRRKAARTPA
ncbi:MAG: DUF2934 domain-containing protein [Alphaproteobacteria bacterium]|nr:MAG: DUF2934 domain-containing protein [Alphaproteobacteria bacterium]